MLIVTAPEPENEVERLNRLADYEILDTEPEEGFDCIARLSADILGTPIALISFIDKDRQWHKAKVGLDMTEVPRSFSFCQHALLEKELLVVPDVTEDERFRTHPLVLEQEGIRFYAAAPIRTPDGLALGTICAIDTEPRQLSEKQIKRFLDLSNLVLAQLELRKKTKIAERASAAKSDFLAVMSHELRTPLNAIIGFSSMIKDQLMGDIENQKYVEYGQNINVAGLHLLDLINDILSLSKAEAGKVEIRREYIDIEEAIRDAAKQIWNEGSEISGRRVKIELDANSRCIWADRRCLRQMLINVLSNANRYSPPEGSIVVSAQLDRANSNIDIRIADEGIGIPQEDLEKVLEPFGQSQKSPYKSHEGTGLGLSICRKLMQLHGGEIAIQSRVGEGTIVSLRFPVRIQSEQY